jgi:rhamnosyltransferase
MALIMAHKKNYKIAGVVILYHPDKHFRENIDSYIENIDVLFAIDNTEIPSSHVKEQLANDKIIYMPYNDNLGVAKALNDAASLAIHRGYDFLLTMDQDSKALPGMIPDMLACLAEEAIEIIGVISPQHIMSHLKEAAIPAKTYKATLTTMTSGNLLNLTAFRKTGPFTEKLFIDAVDLDYCLRLHQKGFQVIESYNAKLIHQLGKVTSHNLLGREVYASHHPAVRRYYIARNYLYVIRKYKAQYPAFCRTLILTILLSPPLILLFEKDKLKKIKMMLLGILDYRKGVYGKCKTM